MTVTRNENDEIVLNDREREMWVRNNSFLHNWFLGTDLSMRDFIRSHRDDIDKYVRAEIDGKKPRTP